jgi:antitoxin ParD1/3/4
MNISLTPELEKIIRDEVKLGLYNNASEVVREALRWWHETKCRERSARVTAAINEGIAAADRGEKTELTRELRDRILAGSRARAAQGAPIDPLISGKF